MKILHNDRMKISLHAIRLRVNHSKQVIRKLFFILPQQKFAALREYSLKH
jgi:hypothetical protein